MDSRIVRLLTPWRTLESLRAAMVGLALGCAATNVFAFGMIEPTSGTVGVTAAPTGMPMDAEFWKWALTQGGVIVALLVIVWSYRRDFVRIINHERDKVDTLLKLVAETNTTMANSTSQHAATEKALHRLAKTMEARSYKE